MDSKTYHLTVEKVWHHIESCVDEQCPDLDIEIQGSVMTITCSNKMQIVINKQEPLHELWLASRVGGYHFYYEQGNWIDSQNNQFFTKLTEAFNACGESIEF